MRVRPTATSAAATGAWTAVGWNVFEKLNLVGPFSSGVVVVVFFLVPVLLWVVGVDHLRRHWRDWKYPFSREYWTQGMPQAFVRMLCWFLAASIVGVACSYVLYGRWPVRP